MTDVGVNAPWKLARWAQAAIAVAVVADVFRATAFQAHAVDPGAGTLRTSGQASLVFFYATAAAAALFLVWFTRVRRNAQVISGNPALAAGAWPVVAWFVPLVNLVLPRRFVLDILRASTGGVKPGRDERLVNAWWGAWAGHALLVGIAQEAAPASLPLLVLGGALMATAGILAIQMIQRLTQLQPASQPAPTTPSPLQPDPM
ncbi:DUF4328 domain-containing protein [Streptomyces sp. NPDC007084]|uniref:DUF4328 domain-containing protein n=1 Tax=Streptomyces sp. NPDC007084 TaxID=3154313 RepID=UPI0034515CE3